jgi:DNA helicase MCM8
VVNAITQKTNAHSSEYDMQIINEMKNNPNVYYSLVKSFCPTIYGHELVKAGLLLGIIGGSGRNLSDESTFR